MDIKEKLTTLEKQQLATLTVECQVLEHLHKEWIAKLQEIGRTILARLNLSPDLYGLRYNLNEDLWQAELKQGALIIPPNRETRRAIERTKN